MAVISGPLKDPSAITGKVTQTGTRGGCGMNRQREWLAQAVSIITAEQHRSADTHLIAVPLANAPGIDLYLKDESSHPTGSLKHRLARSLFLHALCNGWIGPQTTLVEASSGSTAVSEAYFARLLGLPFIAVIPDTTAAEKIAAIRHQGGHCHMVDDPRHVYETAERIARETGGHYLDQFTYAERATDWRGNGCIADSIFSQMSRERHPVPDWVVCGAGTGGTSATIGRFIRYWGFKTNLCVADPEASVFHRHYADRSVRAVSGAMSCIEGIGRPRVEPSFVPTVIDRMIAVSDSESIMAARHASLFLARRCGPSTGTNLVACLQIIAEMVAKGETGSIVTLLCDPGERYNSTCFDDGWVAGKGLDTMAGAENLQRFLPLTDTAFQTA